MRDSYIAALSTAEKLALAQRLLAAIGEELSGQPLASDNAPMDTAALSAVQASLLPQVQAALSANPADTDWNAVRKQVLTQP